MSKSITTFVLLINLLSINIVQAQQINYEEVTDQFDLPEGIKMFKGTRSSPALELFYAEIDLSNENIAIRSYLLEPTDNVQELTKDVGAYLGINGGFFSGSTSFSSVVHPGEVKAVNVRALTRSGKTYPVIRSFFGLTYDNEPSVDWIYHFGNELSGIKKYDAPLPYNFEDPTPLAAPAEADGTPYDNLMTGIGGAPVLVQDSASMVTYNEEIMWGSGVGLSNGDPRTAVGFTNENKIIFLVTDGRQAQSVGLSLTEMAEVLLSLGCVEALNLDGGGSSQMAVQDAYVNNPFEVRKVPSILVVTHPDSLGLPKQAINEYIEDTDSPNSTVTGSWNASANPGFYGESPSLITAPGNGSKFVSYEPAIEAEALYEVFGWWVASSNRAKDAPYIIDHVGGTDTVRADQVANGSTWQFLGRYLLDENTKLTVSDVATQGDFVVADAVRFSNYESSFSIEGLSATTDSLELKAGNTATINVKENDKRLGLSDINISIKTNATKGMAALNDDQSISYSADSTASGADEITYELCYGSLGLFCDEGKVIIAIEGIDQPPVTANKSRAERLKIYPNPAGDILKVEHGLASGALEIRVMSFSGKILLEEHFANPTALIELNVSGLPQGLFLLELSQGKNRFMKKVAIK